MKKLNLLLLSMVCLTACLFVGCAEKQAEIDGPVQMKSMELGLEISKADLENNKSGALIGDATNLGDVTIPYCDGTIEDGMIAVATLSIDFLKADGSTNRTIQNEVWKWEVTDLVSEYGKMSTLHQLDFEVDEEKAIITIDDFRVYDGKIGDETYPVENLVFVTPMEGSPYEGYVSTPVSKEFEVDLYEKQYMKMQVLCFNQEDIPYFGFAWSDFEIITADEICLFFNCLGTAAQSRHQVLAAEVKASFFDGNDWAEYWVGQNYSYAGDDVELPLDIEPFCIPCPGNWKGEHMDPDGDGNGDGGFKIDVMPKDGSDVIEIFITEEQIQAFLDNGTKTWNVDGLYDAEIGSANDGVIDVPFIHYTLKDCYKPKAYYSNLLGSGDNKTSDIYALTWRTSPDDDSFEMTKIFTAEGHNHIAMTPDESKLILVSENGDAWGAALSIYDIYSLKMADLRFEAPDPDENEHDPAMTYRFTQLVYSGNQLYGGCNDLNCLVPININLDNNTFTYGPDIIDMTTPAAGETNPIEDVSGGDLLAGEVGGVINLFSFTKDDSGSIIKYWEIQNDMEASEIQSSTVASGLNGITGVCLLKNADGVPAYALTSNGAGFKYWKGAGSYVHVAFQNLETSRGGDMASAFNPCSNEVLIDLFSVSFD